MPNLAVLTELALNFGPFLFVLLFLFVVNRRAYIAYKSEPEDSPRAKIFRGWFIISNAATFLLIAICTIWWIYNPPTRTKLFGGKIIGLQSYEEIESPDLYFKKYEPRFVSSGDVEPKITTREEAFLISDKEAFRKKNKFLIYYRKQGANSSKILTLEYTEKTEPSYRIIYNEKADRHFLKLTAQNNSRNNYWPADAIASAFAQMKEKSAKRDNLSIGSKNKTKDVARSNKITIKLQIIETLQDERTPIGKKIEILDYLKSISTKALDAYLKFSSEKESMILTLLDLSRHTDKQLAVKSRNLLTKFNLRNYILMLVDRPNLYSVNLAREIIEKLSASDADLIFNYISHQIDKLRVKAEKELQRYTAQLRSSRQYNHLKILPHNPNLRSSPKSAIRRYNRYHLRTLRNIRSLHNLKLYRTKALIPTGTNQGDRYYVRARWSTGPESEKIVKCLTSLFFDSLIHNRSLVDEQDLMKRLNGTRYVYWYSKEWALSMANKIVNCGGNANFVNGITFATKSNNVF